MVAGGGRGRIDPRVSIAWRFAVLVGVATGAASAAHLGAAAASADLLVAGAIGGVLLAFAGPGRTAGERPAPVRRPWRPRVAAWLVLVAAASGAIGAGVGSQRLAAIDGGALRAAPGAAIAIEGHVSAVPRRSRGQVSVRVDSEAGRVLVVAPEPVADLDVGALVRASGRVRRPAAYERGHLRRLGVARVLGTRSIKTTGEMRGGVIGALDEVRNRAQAALTEGTPPPAAALLRGFVLGQDDRIDPRTADEFRRSGLAHLLAVSGQNVLLLSILAAAVMAALGIGIRARLLWTLALIGVYVLVTGAGPSIQRAGVMGAAGIVAALAGRPRSRWYAVLLAAAVTLLLDPRAAADPGWQLSFAAVAGILSLGAPLRRLFAGARPGRVRAAVAEAAALTTSATVATLPLSSLHFGTVSVVSLPANLVAVSAEAPVMWLGMLVSAAGQLEWVPVWPVTWLAGLLAGYIAQVADWFAAPGWAQAELALPGAGALAGVYAAAATALALAIAWARRRRELGLASPRWPGGGIRGPVVFVAISAGIALAGDPTGDPVSQQPPAGTAGGEGLRVTMLDVGQGDAILLETRPAREGGGEAVLVDAGPPGGGLARTLDELGVSNLAALVLTHPDSDHVGGAPEVLETLSVGRLLFSDADRASVAAARANGVAVRPVAAGSTLRLGRLRLRALWPPASHLLASPDAGVEPNARSLVLLARWRRFRMLLSGDAEAELAPVHPGDVDVLKLAHHGSADAGLASLLSEARPELALASVGDDNGYGHPAPATLAELARARVPLLRTDRDGTVVLRVDRTGLSVFPPPPPP